MPTRRTTQLFLKPQPCQSSDQIELTQARKKVKDQVTQLPMPLSENHVWLEDLWMVASWCDELLTTLCGLILGYVLQVQVAA
jgi:hypothetical protein